MVIYLLPSTSSFFAWLENLELPSPTGHSRAARRLLRSKARKPTRLPI